MSRLRWRLCRVQCTFVKSLDRRQIVASDAQCLGLLGNVEVGTVPKGLETQKSTHVYLQLRCWQAQSLRCLPPFPGHFPLGLKCSGIQESKKSWLQENHSLVCRVWLEKPAGYTTPWKIGYCLAEGIDCASVWEPKENRLQTFVSGEGGTLRKMISFNRMLDSRGVGGFRP